MGNGSWRAVCVYSLALASGCLGLEAAAIKVGSIADARFQTSWTLNGDQMANTRAKLLNSANFGPSGTVRRAIEIGDVGGAAGSVDQALLDQFEVFFIGWLSDGSVNAFQPSELEALATWVFEGGTLIVTCDDAGHDRVCEYFGFPINVSAESPAAPVPEVLAHPLVKGPFGEVAQIYLSGNYSGFDRTTGAVVVFREASVAQFPNVMTRRWGSGRLILIGDIDIIANAASSGDAITTANDRFLGNLFAFAARPYDLVLDAAAHTPGVGASEWRDDVDLLNLGADGASVGISLLKVSQANLNPATAPVVVPAGRTLRLTDVLAGLFNAGNAGLGLFFTGGEVHANSRFYNVGSTDGNVFGMYIPSTDDTETVWYGRPGVFHHLSYSTSSSTGSRVNIGGTSRSPFAVEVQINLYGDAGELLGIHSHTYLPYEHRQFTKIHQILGTPAVTHGHATVEVKTPGGAVDMYAMLIENRSGDPIYMPPAFAPAAQSAPTVAAAGAPGVDEGGGGAAELLASGTCEGPYDRFIAAAANTTGVNATRWLTDVDLLNLGAQPASIDIARLEANQANTDPLVATVSVPAGGTVRVANVLGTLLPAGNAGLGIRFCRGEAHVNSRFFNTGSANGNVYGMFVPSMGVDQAVTPCRPGVFHHLSYSPDSKVGQRINIGATNATGVATTWSIKLYGDGGALIGTQAGTLLPYEHRQYTNIHKILLTPAVTNGWASVEVATPGGRIHPYAMRIENVGGDPIYMPAELLDLATSERVADALAGQWSGGWVNTTFQSNGGASLALAFDLPGQAVTATLDLDGSVFGGADPPPQTLTGSITSTGAVFEGVSAALGTYSLTVDGLCSVAGTLTNLPSPNIERVELSGRASPTDILVGYTVTFTAQGGGGAATGTLTLSR